MHKKYNNEDFIQKCKEKHGDTYDYSLVNFTHTKIPVEIICKTHGRFMQIPNNHLNGAGCKKCGDKIRGNNLKHTKDVFLEKAIAIHGNKFDYSSVIYVNSQTKISIICPKHGAFEQRPSSHLLYGCNKCENNIISEEEFILTSMKIHFNKYNYEKVIFKNSQSKVEIICPEHGAFEQKAYHHMNGTGCQKCNMSIGVATISNFLINYNIKFVTEKRFKECKNIYTLPFDFYLPDYNLCIEFDGEQHYKPMGYEKGLVKFDNTIKRDKIKNEFCEKEKIKLIRIKYNENIQDSLSKELHIFIRKLN